MGEGRKERKRNINVWVASPVPPTGDLACNPGMCPDWELNLLPFGSQAGTQSIEPQQPGQISDFFTKFKVYCFTLRRHLYSP